MNAVLSLLPLLVAAVLAVALVVTIVQIWGSSELSVG